MGVCVFYKRTREGRGGGEERRCIQYVPSMGGLCVTKLQALRCA